MAWYEWLPIALGIVGIITGTAAGVRFLVKHYFEEIKHELKPNGGSSIKDQITRVEKAQNDYVKRQHEDDVKFEHRIDKLETKIDDVMKLIIEKLG